MLGGASGRKHPVKSVMSIPAVDGDLFLRRFGKPETLLSKLLGPGQVTEASRTFNRRQCSQPGKEYKPAGYNS